MEQPVSFKNVTITWNRKVTKELHENQPDMVLVDRKKNRMLVFDFAVVNDEWVGRTAQRKVEKYQHTAHLFKQKEKLSFSMVIPVVISNNGLLSKETTEKAQESESEL